MTLVPMCDLLQKWRHVPRFQDTVFRGLPLAIPGDQEGSATSVGMPTRVRPPMNEEADSLTFAGDVPEAAAARLKKANCDRLINGTAEAVRTSKQALAGSSSSLAVLVSCVGGKLVLKQRAEEEVEAVRDVVGPEPILAGF